MRSATLWRSLIGVEKTVVEDVELDAGSGDLVVRVRPSAGRTRRCPACGRRCPRYDRGSGCGQRRRWRHTDFGGMRVWLEAATERVSCRRHGVVVAEVPWARHDAGHTYAFDQTVAWLVTRMAKSAVSELMRTSWRTVGNIMARVWADLDDPTTRLAGLTRIGIDEVSYKRGYRYLVVVVDHDSHQLVWAGEGKTMATLDRFFDLLGEQGCAQISHVSADGADWISKVVSRRCPTAVRAADPFHVVQWANDALGTVRIQAWNQAREQAKLEPPRSTGWAARTQDRPAADLVKGLKGARFALWRNPEDLTEKQQAKLDWIAVADRRLYRAYLLKERLRIIFTMTVADAETALDHWVAAARRSRIEAFVTLQRRITRYRAEILAAIEHQISNGPIESVNNKIRVLTRIAYGYRNAAALIALAMLALSGPKLALPDRT